MSIDVIILKHANENLRIACNRLGILSEHHPENDVIQEIYLETLELQIKINNYMEYLKCLTEEIMLKVGTRL